MSVALSVFTGALVLPAFVKPARWLALLAALSLFLAVASVTTALLVVTAVSLSVLLPN